MHTQTNSVAFASSAAAADGVKGLDEWAMHERAEIVGFTSPANDDQSHTLLRLLEVGFLPGECVRLTACGLPGRDPLAVRVGQSTFALRRHEAALVRVASPDAAALVRVASPDAAALMRVASPGAAALGRVASPDAAALMRVASPDAAALASAVVAQGQA